MFRQHGVTGSLNNGSQFQKHAPLAFGSAIGKVCKANLIAGNLLKRP